MNIINLLKKKEQPKKTDAKYWWNRIKNMTPDDIGKEFKRPVSKHMIWCNAKFVKEWEGDSEHDEMIKICEDLNYFFPVIIGSYSRTRSKRTDPDRRAEFLAKGQIIYDVLTMKSTINGKCMEAFAFDILQDLPIAKYNYYTKPTDNPVVLLRKLNEEE